MNPSRIRNVAPYVSHFRGFWVVENHQNKKRSPLRFLFQGFWVMENRQIKKRSPLTFLVFGVFGSWKTIKIRNVAPYIFIFGVSGVGLGV